MEREAVTGSSWAHSLDLKDSSFHGRAVAKDGQEPSPLRGAQRWSLSSGGAAKEKPPKQTNKIEMLSFFQGAIQQTSCLREQPPTAGNPQLVAVGTSDS